MGVPVQVSFTGTAVKQLYRSLPVCTGKNAQLYSKAERKLKNHFAAGLKFLEVYMSGLNYIPHL